MAADFPTPAPQPIDAVSPSLANQLMSCQLRVAFARDPQHKGWRRPSTFSALGTVAHAVTEEAFKRNDWPGDPAAARAALHGVWDDHVDREAKRLAEAWAPATPPPPGEWPGYALTKARTVRRALKHITKEPVASAGAELPAGTGVEIELRDEHSGLFGRADRIDAIGGTTQVVDLKTGLNQEEPSEEQRRQLHLYAVLVHAETGSWPTSIAVEDASGQKYEEALDPDEAKATLAEVLEAVRQFNEHTKAIDLLDTARPDAERCRWCPFRVVCSPYWDALRADWEHRAALGSVRDSGAAETGAFVTLDIEHPADRAPRTVHISGLAQAIPDGAAHLAVVDWAGVATAEDVRARWTTMSRAW